MEFSALGFPVHHQLPVGACSNFYPLSQWCQSKPSHPDAKNWFIERPDAGKVWEGQGGEGTTEDEWIFRRSFWIKYVKGLKHLDKAFKEMYYRK